MHMRCKFNNIDCDCKESRRVKNVERTVNNRLYNPTLTTSSSANTWEIAPRYTSTANSPN